MGKKKQRQEDDSFRDGCDSAFLGQGKPGSKPSIFHFRNEEVGIASLIIPWCQVARLRNVKAEALAGVDKTLGEAWWEEKSQVSLPLLEPLTSLI